jgi:quercetin dioxygenase-like cupin family protein
MNANTRRRAIVRGPAEGTPVWFLGNLMVVKATAEETNGGFGLLESVVRAGSSPPLHVHHREDETFYVLEGQLTVLCGDETYTAPAGSFIFLPRDVPHTYRVDGDKPARLLTLLTPGGTEAFFVEGGCPAETLTLPAEGPHDFGAIARLSLQYDSEIIGPPLKPANA